MKVTLQTIRDAKTLEDLKPAIIFLCDNMQSMTWGEFTAFQRTIENQALKIGVSLEKLNSMATDYQQLGTI